MLRIHPTVSVVGMSSDDDFEPRLGRMRAKGSRQGRKFLHRILAAANLARGGSGSIGQQARFNGSRIGRGAGVGRVLASRDRYASFRTRRVIIKSMAVAVSSTARTLTRSMARRSSIDRPAIAISSASSSRPKTARIMMI